jgi:glyceraldehyde 3-phosphate dehydrogenase
MAIKVAINGYGRIGRGLHRRLLDGADENIEVVAINSRSHADSHAYLLKYDTLYGKCDADISVDGDNLKINGKTVYVYRVKDPSGVNWAKHDVDVVIESTGRFTNYEDAEKHLKAGGKRVIVTAPCKDPKINNLVMGVNHTVCDVNGCKVVSNASCTTNCLAPVLNVLNKEFGIEKAFVSSLHAFTHTQNLLDNSNPEDFRRARAATQSIIPTTTGAMQAIGRVIPELDGKIDGMAYRLPVPVVSCIDCVLQLNEDVSAEAVNKAFKKYEEGDLKGILGTSDDPLVSSDFKGDTRSAIIDTNSTLVMPGGFVKVIAWYDNEWGYISRIVDLIKWFNT